jgi:hypothetical protein
MARHILDGHRLPDVHFTANERIQQMPIIRTASRRKKSSKRYIQQGMFLSQMDLQSPLYPLVQR